MSSTNEIMEAVYTAPDHSGVYADSTTVAEAFKRRHDNVLQIVRRHLKNKSISLLNIKESDYTDSRGKVRTMYLLDRKSFLVVVLSFTGSDADRIKGKFVDAFLSQEQELIQWRESRKEIKQYQRTYTDEVQRLADALERDGSKHAKLIYPTLQRQVNKCQTHRSTPRGQTIESYRETLSDLELQGIKRLENVIMVIIDHYLTLGATGRATREAVKRFLNGECGREWQL